MGEQPIIHPGDEFEYTSGTPLKTSSGLMHGLSNGGFKTLI